MIKGGGRVLELHAPPNIPRGSCKMGSKSRAQAKQRSQRYPYSQRIRPLLECLEDRTLPSSQAVFDFGADLRQTTPTTGWQYLWNANGPIGNASNYVALMPTPPGSDFFGNKPYYTRDGNPALPRAEPAAYLN